MKTCRGNINEKETEKAILIGKADFRKRKIIKTKGYYIMRK